MGKLLDDWVLFMLLWLLGGACGIAVGVTSERDAWQRKAIAHGAAEYRVNAETGEVQFHWKAESEGK